MAERSQILIIGATGYLGKFLVEAAAKNGHQTFALVRESAISDPVKGKLIESFKTSGVTVIYGDVHDHQSLVKAVKQVDVVISAVAFQNILDQSKILEAIEEAGNVKRFIPSEFGNDVDRTDAVEPAKTNFAEKAKVRRAIEAHGIPYTYIFTGCFAGYFLPTLAQPGATAPPREKVIILGDGTPKEAPAPLNIILSISHSVFIKGDQTNFEIEASFGHEASELYPDVKYTTVDEYLHQFV
ncbi:hypothetical protein AgCh_010306 [Apium graveolens]